MAPEMKHKYDQEDRDEQYNLEAVDVWSLCATFLTLTTLKNPHASEYINAAKGIKEFPKMQGYTKQFRDLLLAGLQFDPLDRISFQQLLDRLLNQRSKRKISLRAKARSQSNIYGTFQSSIGESFLSGTGASET